MMPYWLVNSLSARGRLVYHGVGIVAPSFLQRAKEPLAIFYAKLKPLLRLLFSFIDHILIPPSPHPAFYSRDFLAMNPQVFP